MEAEQMLESILQQPLVLTQESVNLLKKSNLANNNLYWWFNKLGSLTESEKNAFCNMVLDENGRTLMSLLLKMIVNPSKFLNLIKSVIM